MKQLIRLTLLIISSTLSAQTTYTYTGIGDWTEQTNWSPSYPGTTISETDEVIIATESEVTALYMTINGKITINGDLETRSTFTVNGELIINGYLNSRSTLRINGTATNNGTHQSSSFYEVYGVYTNKATLRLSSVSKIYPDGILNNEDTITGIYLYNNGTLNNTGTYTNNLYLYGDNNVHTADFTNSKNLRPGSTSSTIGTYNFNANLTLSSGSTLLSEIKNTEEVDLVNVNNTATIGGKLEVSLLDDYDPAIGTTFTIVQANTITGAFSNINYPDLGSDKEFSITYNDDSVLLEVIESAKTYIYTGIGDWTEQANWSPSYPGTTIKAIDEVIIATDSEVTASSTNINGKIIINGELETRSSLTINGELIINGYLNNRSTLTINGTATNNGTHQSSSFLNIYGIYTNNETLRLSSISEIQPTGVLNNKNTITGIYLYNNGTLNNTGTYTNNLYLFGDNNVHTSNFTNNKILSAGSNFNTIGTYNFDANLTLSSGSTLLSEIKSTEEVDLINANTTATIGGKLEVSLLDDYDPAIGTTYTILQATSITGTFSSIKYPDLGSDKIFSIIYNANSIVLEVTDTSTLSISDNTLNNNVVIYPNPASDVLYIDHVNQVEDVILYSILGTEIKTITLTLGKNSLDLSSLNKGMYILIINNKTYKFIKN